MAILLSSGVMFHQHQVPCLRAFFVHALETVARGAALTLQVVFAALMFVNAQSSASIGLMLPLHL